MRRPPGPWPRTPCRAVAGQPGRARGGSGGVRVGSGVGGLVGTTGTSVATTGSSVAPAAGTPGVADAAAATLRPPDSCGHSPGMAASTSAPSATMTTAGPSQARPPRSASGRGRNGVRRVVRGRGVGWPCGRRVVTTAGMVARDAASCPRPRVAAALGRPATGSNGGGGGIPDAYHAGDADPHPQAGADPAPGRRRHPRAAPLGTPRVGMDRGPAVDHRTHRAVRRHRAGTGCRCERRPRCDGGRARGRRLLRGLRADGRPMGLAGMPARRLGRVRDRSGCSRPRRRHR